MAVVRKMILVYPDAYEKLLRKVNLMSSQPEVITNDFDRWMKIQQKMMEYRLRQDRLKPQIKSISRSDDFEKFYVKKIKKDEDQLLNPTKNVSTQYEEDDFTLTRNVSTQLESDFEDNTQDQAVGGDTISGDHSVSEDESITENILYPKTPAAPVKDRKKRKKKNNKPVATKTVFAERLNEAELIDSTMPTYKLDTRSKTQNQKGKNIINWDMF